MKTIIRLSIACALALFTADIARQKAEAGIFDVFKSGGKKNDEWFAANRQNITGQFTSLGYLPSTNNQSGQTEKLQALCGWVENKSDQQISALVFDVVVSRPGTGLEVLKERVWLGVTVFKTEKINFTNGLPSMEIGSSQIFECLERNTNCQWSGDIVVAIPHTEDLVKGVEKEADLQKYYKVKSIWYLK